MHQKFDINFYRTPWSIEISAAIGSRTICEYPKVLYVYVFSRWFNLRTGQFIILFARYVRSSRQKIMCLSHDSEYYRSQRLQRNVSTSTIPDRLVYCNRAREEGLLYSDTMDMHGTYDIGPRVEECLSRVPCPATVTSSERFPRATSCGQTCDDCHGNKIDDCRSFRVEFENAQKRVMFRCKDHVPRQRSLRTSRTYRRVDPVRNNSLMIREIAPINHALENALWNAIQNICIVARDARFGDDTVFTCTTYCN